MRQGQCKVAEGIGCEWDWEWARETSLPVHLQKIKQNQFLLKKAPGLGKLTLWAGVNWDTQVQVSHHKCPCLTYCLNSQDRKQGGIQWLKQRSLFPSETTQVRAQGWHLPQHLHGACTLWENTSPSCLESFGRKYVTIWDWHTLSREGTAVGSQCQWGKLKAWQGALAQLQW